MICIAMAVIRNKRVPIASDADVELEWCNITELKIWADLLNYSEGNVPAHHPVPTIYVDALLAHINDEYHWAERELTTRDYDYFDTLLWPHLTDW